MKNEEQDLRGKDAYCVTRVTVAVALIETACTVMRLFDIRSLNTHCASKLYKCVQQSNVRCCCQPSSQSAADCSFVRTWCRC